MKATRLKPNPKLNVEIAAASIVIIEQYLTLPHKDDEVAYALEQRQVMEGIVAAC